MYPTPSQRKWVRSNDGILFGVCKGLGESFGIDPGLLRGLWLFSIFFLGTGIFVYLILAFVLPTKDQLYDYETPKFLGVCLRISQKYKVELAAVRILCVILFFASGGLTLLLYFILHFVLPYRHT